MRQFSLLWCWRARVFRCRGKQSWSVLQPLPGTDILWIYVTLRHCGGCRRGDRWRQRRFLGRPGIWHVIACAGIFDRARRTEKEPGTVSICPPRREDRLLRKFRCFTPRLCGAAGWRKRIVPYKVSHLQRSWRNCLGDSVRSWWFRTWRRYSSNRRTIWMDGAHCGDRCCPLSMALLQEK